MSNEKNRQSWNKLSEYYQSSTGISLTDIHYAPYSPGEKKIKIIGDVKGLDVVELGCGGGQIAIVLSKMGANSVTALDISDQQLAHARKLAERENTDITFHQGDMEILSEFHDSSFDLIVSVHAISYVSNLQNVFSEISRILRPNGRVVICTIHPLQYVLWEALEENSMEKIQSYFSSDPSSWDWIDNKKTPIATFTDRAHRYEEFVNGIIKNGLDLEGVIEPRGYTTEELKEMNLEDVPYHNHMIDEQFTRINKIIPFSIIYSAKKKENDQ
ncbi:MAG: class I SAM-dependent methyltransferase [Candidatus Hodarchaeales archaeon]